MSLFKNSHAARLRNISWSALFTYSQRERLGRAYFSGLKSVNCSSSNLLRSPFSTMTMLQSHATTSIDIRDYDPEIKDMASYVHTHKIDSDLAVRFIFVAF